MAAAALATKPPPIKPDDMVRLPSGRTAICVAINNDGSRLLEDVLSGERMNMMASQLYLVRAAPCRRWPSYRIP